MRPPLLAVPALGLVLTLVCLSTRGSPPAVRPSFEDKTLGSGITFVTRNEASPEKHLIETMAGGVAVFDFDRDGLPDIYLVNGAPQPSLRKSDARFLNRLYRNRGDWTFEDVTGRSGLGGTGFDMAAAAADYDNDGNPDLFVASVEGGALYRNRGDGTFENVTAHAGIVSPGWSVGAAWLDYDNDGFPDLFVVRYVLWNPADEPWCGELSPKIRTYCHPRFYAATSNQLFHNNGNGTFTDVSLPSGIGAHAGKGMSAAVADYDGDGRPDIFVANDSLPNFLFHNEGQGRFREVGLRSGTAFNDDGTVVSSMGSVFGDLDNDGREDLVVTALAHETFPLFHNAGDGTFVDRTYAGGLARAAKTSSGWGVGIGDLDNDGHRDLLIACGDVQNNAGMFSARQSRQRNLLLWNDGAAVFRPEAFGTPALHRGLAFADFDRDGRLDAVITRLNQTPLLLRNIVPAGNHWAGLRLEGTVSNRDALGARVTIQTGKLIQVATVRPEGGYASSGEPLLHFGLGTHDRIDRIDVEWPSGVKQSLENQPANRVIRIEEPRP